MVRKLLVRNCSRKSIYKTISYRQKVEDTEQTVDTVACADLLHQVLCVL